MWGRATSICATNTEELCDALKKYSCDSWWKMAYREEGVEARSLGQWVVQGLDNGPGTGEWQWWYQWMSLGCVSALSSDLCLCKVWRKGGDWEWKPGFFFEPLWEQWYNHGDKKDQPESKLGGKIRRLILSMLGSRSLREVSISSWLYISGVQRGNQSVSIGIVAKEMFKTSWVKSIEREGKGGCDLAPGVANI